MFAVRVAMRASILVLFLFFGCGSSSDQPEIAEATGYVTLDGIPMSCLLVMFGPDEGRTSFAWTDNDGYFELMYVEDTPGAIVGPHTVSISSGHEEEEEPEPGEKPFVEPIPEVYNTKSTLTAEVTSDGPNEFTFDLSSEG